MSGETERRLREAGLIVDGSYGPILDPDAVLALLDRATALAPQDEPGLREAAQAVVDAVAAWHLPTTVGSPRLGDALIALRAAVALPAATEPAPEPEDAVDLAALLHDNDFSWEWANAVNAVLTHHGLVVKRAATEPADGLPGDDFYKGGPWHRRTVELLSLLGDAAKVQRTPCNHSGIGLPGCVTCDPRIYNTIGVGSSEKAAP